MEPERIRPGRRLHNIGVVEAPVETGLVAIARLMVPVLDVRIIQIVNDHALAVGRVDARHGTGEAARLMHGRLARAVRLRVAGQVDVGAASFGQGEAVAGFGGRVGTHVALILDHGLTHLRQRWLRDGRIGCGVFLRKALGPSFGTAMAVITEARPMMP